MAKVNAADLQERQKGHLIKVDEWNAIVRALKAMQASTFGSTAEGYQVIANRRKVHARGVHVQTTETIPPFSIFSGTNETPSVFDEPMLLKARKIGIAEPGPHGLLLTNGQIEITANTQGIAKIINYGDVTRLKFTGTTPKIGDFVGPEIDGFNVTKDEEYGLVVVGLVDDDDDDKVEVVRSHEPCSIIGEVTTEISEFNPGTKTLGSGVIKVEYRDTTSDILKEGKNPGTQAIPWPHTVFSLCDHVIPVGDIAKCSYVMGIGLVVDAECELAAAPSAGTGGVTEPAGKDVDGLELRWQSVSSVSLDPGDACDSTGKFNINLTFQTSVSLGCVGSPGCLDTGSESSLTWYAVHLIGDSTNANNPSVIFSVSDTSPTLPTGYDVFRFIGWVRNNPSSDLWRFFCIGNGKHRRHYWDEDAFNFSVLSFGTSTFFTGVFNSSYIPPTSRLGRWRFDYFNSAGFEGFALRPSGSSVSSFDAPHRFQPGVFTSFNPFTGMAELPTDDFQVIEFAVASGSDFLELRVQGFDYDI